MLRSKYQKRIFNYNQGHFTYKIVMYIYIFLSDQFFIKLELAMYDKLYHLILCQLNLVF